MRDFLLFVSTILLICVGAAYIVANVSVTQRTVEIDSNGVCMVYVEKGPAHEKTWFAKCTPEEARKQ